MPRKYMAAQGDCWDLISFKVYQDEGFIDTLLCANPDLRRIVIFEEPAMITIPDRPIVEPGSVTLLPPWKRR